MTPERWRRVEQVYQSTMDQEPRLRAAFLAEACGTDEELRHEVDSLLALNHSPVMVDEPAWQAVAELLADNTQLAPGTQLGPYRPPTYSGCSRAVWRRTPSTGYAISRMHGGCWTKRP